MLMAVVVVVVVQSGVTKERTKYRVDPEEDVARRTANSSPCGSLHFVHGPTIHHPGRPLLARRPLERTPWRAILSARRTLISLVEKMDDEGY